MNTRSGAAALLLLFLIPFSRAAENGGKVHFAVIGDYGFDSQSEADVARLVDSWKPDFIITTGDNNYDSGADSTIDRNIGKYYHSYISPYHGHYGTGDTVNRFFPSMGNHDWLDPGAAAYLRYFTLPGNERYYDVVRGCVHLFAIDSDDKEPDGNAASSRQAAWLKAALAASTSVWNVVYFHHPPYSSGRHGGSEQMRWPFGTWGASVVMSGHDHTYERIVVDSLLYLVDGLGGRSMYEMKKTATGSQVRFTGEYGAMDVVADESHMTFRFITRRDSLVDTVTLRAKSKQGVH